MWLYLTVLFLHVEVFCSNLEELKTTGGDEYQGVNIQDFVEATDKSHSSSKGYLKPTS